MPDDGVAPGLKGEPFFHPAVDQQLGDPLGPGHALEKVVVRQKDVFLRDGFHFFQDSLGAFHPAFSVEEFPHTAKITAVGAPAGGLHDGEGLLETQVIMLSVGPGQVPGGHGKFVHVIHHGPRRG